MRLIYEFMLEKDEENLVNIPKTQSIFRSFQKPGPLIIAIMAILLTSADSQGIFVPQSPAYAETVPDIEKASNTPVVEKPGDRVFSIMQQQLRSYQQRLEESEGRLQDFQRKHGIILLETQMNHLLQQRKSLDDSLMDAENKVKGFQEKFAWVQGQISQIPDEVPLSSSAREQGLIGGAKK